MERSIASIKNYMRRTGISKELEQHYEMNIDEYAALRKLYRDDVTEGIYLAFQFGRAKGYRAAKAEARR